MEHFGLQDVTEIPDGFVPVDVSEGLPQLRRDWLHEKVGQVVDTFVMMTGITEAASQRQASTQLQQFQCRADGSQDSGLPKRSWQRPLIISTSSCTPSCIAVIPISVASFTWSSISAKNGETTMTTGFSLCPNFLATIGAS
ncbi:unnamed protein product [Gadus morhua 'NCC']